MVRRGGSRGVCPYVMRTIRSLQVVEDDAIDYSFKRCDRTSLSALVARKGECDEIIIVKNGLLTDTSYTNLALFDGHDGSRPANPCWLAPGVPRS